MIRIDKAAAIYQDTATARKQLGPTPFFHILDPGFFMIPFT